MKNLLFIGGVILSSLGMTNVSYAVEYPIGKPVLSNGMEIAAVYLQPVEMEPPCFPADKSDVHLEADIHATEDNINGFPEGAWIPYLRIDYKLQKVGTNKVTTGHLMPMVANDGPHYGRNVKLMGPGKYHLTFSILPPKGEDFSRHIDKETGVPPFFQKIVAEYDFVFAGTGKKGGY